MKTIYTGSLKFIIILCFCISQVYADSSHQFEINIGSQITKLTASDGDAMFRYVSGTAYFNSVKKSASLPYSRSAFYNKTGSISFSASQSKWKELNTVVSGRVLDRSESKSYAVSTFLAHKDFPLWTSISYSYLDKAKRNFTNGTSDVSEGDSAKYLSLGAYLGNFFSVYGLYLKTEDNSYGVGISKLFNLSEFGFLESVIELSRTDSEDEGVDIQNNVVRNLGNSAINEKSGYFQLSYFPFPETEFGLAYRQVGFDLNHWKNHYYYGFVEQYLNENIAISINYTHKDAYRSYYGNLGNHDTYGLNLALNF